MFFDKILILCFYERLMIIPNIINIIWFGSFLKKEHQDRIIAWRAQNPQHTIILWFNPYAVDSSTRKRFISFCTDHKIRLFSIEGLHSKMKEKTRLWIEKTFWMTRKLKDQNYGALSDIYRLFILRSVGGWYFDTDIIPVLPLPTHLSLQYGFAIYGLANPDTKEVLNLSPAILVSNKNNGFIQTGIALIDSMACNISTERVDTTLYSNNLLIRYVSTQHSVGCIFYYALLKIFVGYEPILVDNYRPEYTDIDVFSNISIMELPQLKNCFHMTHENTWLSAEQFDYEGELSDREDFSAYSQHKVAPEPCQDFLREFFEGCAENPNIRLPSLASLSIKRTHGKMTFFTHHKTVSLKTGATKALCPSV